MCRNINPYSHNVRVYIMQNRYLFFGGGKKRIAGKKEKIIYKKRLFRLKIASYLLRWEKNGSHD